MHCSEHLSLGFCNRFIYPRPLQLSRLTVIIQLQSLSHFRREMKQGIVCLGLEIITQYLRYLIFVVCQRIFRREICRGYNQPVVQ